MISVRIVTDSTADIPAALASDLGIVVVPCQVYLDGEVYEDGVDLRPEAFYNRLAASSEMPRTSQPPVSRFLEIYQQLVDGDHIEKVISIHLAGKLSGTLNAAWAAAQMLPDPSRVEVIDSGQISMGLGWAAIEAARLAHSGVPAAQVSQSIRALLPRLRTVAMIDDLQSLYKGGRISLLTAALGAALQVKPLLSLQNGEISVWGKARTRSRALDQLVAYIRTWGPLLELAVLHTKAEQLARGLADALRDLVPSDRMLILPAGSAITTHLSIGAVGVCAMAAAPAMGAVEA